MEAIFNLATTPLLVAALIGLLFLFGKLFGFF